MWPTVAFNRASGTRFLVHYVLVQYGLSTTGGIRTVHSRGLGVDNEPTGFLFGANFAEILSSGELALVR